MAGPPDLQNGFEHSFLSLGVFRAARTWQVVLSIEQAEQPDLTSTIYCSPNTYSPSLSRLPRICFLWEASSGSLSMSALMSSWLCSHFISNLGLRWSIRLGLGTWAGMVRGAGQTDILPGGGIIKPAPT